MLSRRTGFLSSDGEKEWRDRDAEFENYIGIREELSARWKEGWSCLFREFDTLTEADPEKIIFIRNLGHSVTEAINRQLGHCAYHVGQLVFIGKMARGSEWVSRSIPQGRSKEYNADKFSRPRQREHFTDEFKKKDNR